MGYDECFCYKLWKREVMIPYGMRKILTAVQPVKAHSAKLRKKLLTF